MDGEEIISNESLSDSSTKDVEEVACTRIPNKRSKLVIDVIINLKIVGKTSLIGLQGLMKKQGPNAFFVVFLSQSLMVVFQISNAI